MRSVKDRPTRTDTEVLAIQHAGAAGGELPARMQNLIQSICEHTRLYLFEHIHRAAHASLYRACVAQLHILCQLSKRTHTLWRLRDYAVRNGFIQSSELKQ